MGQPNLGLYHVAQVEKEKSQLRSIYKTVNGSRSFSLVNGHKVDREHIPQQSLHR